jgi:hypothetical protein
LDVASTAVLVQRVIIDDLDADLRRKFVFSLTGPHKFDILKKRVQTSSATSSRTAVKLRFPIQSGPLRR